MSFMGIGCSLQTSVKHNASSNIILFVLNQGPLCPEARSVLYWNVVRFVLRRGPFCPETWSVLSGPFCPWSVLSEYQWQYGHWGKRPTVSWKQHMKGGAHPVLFNFSSVYVFKKDAHLLLDGQQLFHCAS